MAVIQGGVVANKQEVDLQLAARVAVFPPPVSTSGGRYRLVLMSGLLTTVAAHTATAGHCAAIRWGSTTKKALLDYLRIQAAIVTDFTTLQQLSFGARMARSYSASHTGGTTATLTGDNAKLASGYQTTALTDARIGTTGALTAGTHIIDTQPILLANSGQPAASTTTVKVGFEAIFDARAQGAPIILAANEGIVISNEILQGAAGTIVLTVTAEWREALNAEVPAGI